MSSSISSRRRVSLTSSTAKVLCEQPTQQDYVDGLVKHQLVLEFDMETWKVSTPRLLTILYVTEIYPMRSQRAIEVFNITEPMIPQRPKSEMRIGQKWYG